MIINPLKAQIERGKDLTKLIVSHGNKKLEFVYPPIKGTYRKVGAKILEKGYKIPTGDETASLLYSIYFSELKNEPEFKFLRNIIESYKMGGVLRKEMQGLAEYTSGAICYTVK